MRERFQLSLILALLGIALAAVMVMTTLPTHSTTAQAAISDTPTATATTTTTPTVTPLGCAAPLNLTEDMIVYIHAGVHIRSAPTVNSPYLKYLEQNTAYRIRGGPVCANGYNWWDVSLGSMRGWVAEGQPDGSVYFIADSGETFGEVILDCGDSSGFVIGETILLYRSLRVRQAPGLGSLILTVAPDGAEAVVLEGPVCQDTYNWWKVRVQVLNVIYDGWIAQGTRQSTQDWLESEAALAAEVCGPPVPLSIGQAARIHSSNNVPKRMRTYPSLDAPVLYDLIGNVPVIIVNGPICNDGFNWWQVSVRSNIAATGWVADGGGQRWIRSLPDPDY